MKNEVRAIGFIGGEGSVISENISKDMDSIFLQYSSTLSPNRKPVSGILDRIKDKYPTEKKINSKSFRLDSNLKSRNEHTLKIDYLYIKNEGTGAALYNLQEQEYIDLVNQKLANEMNDFSKFKPDIRIGYDILSDYIFVEGSKVLSDEVLILRGLDAIELQNKFQVANYIITLKKYGLLK